MTPEPHGLPIACTLDAAALAKRREELHHDLFAFAAERRELADGMAFRFPGSDEFKDKLLAFAAAERTCCAFFRIELAFGPESGPIWLTLRGSEGVKDFIQHTFESEQNRAGPIMDEGVSERTLGGPAVSVSVSVPEQTRHKGVVRRLVDEVLNGGRLEVIDELYAPALAADAKQWIAPFRASFPDMRMAIVDLIAEGDIVAGRFTCSGTHLGDWLGHAPTGRRFEAVDEVSIFRFQDGKIAHAWGLEDTLGRLEQLGLR